MLSSDGRADAGAATTSIFSSARSPSPSLASQAINVNRRSVVGRVVPPRSPARRRVAPTPEPFSVESKFSATPKAARRSGRGDE